MHFTRLSIHHQTVAEVVLEDVVIHTTQDALDILGNASYQGADCMLMYTKNFVPEFFDLRTGLAGDILQKFTNYKMKLILIGDFETFSSNALRAFMIEANRGKQLAFVSSKEKALETLERWSKAK
ncbi:MAG: DUF4180 domain-containing protein [Trueperaceae bacterium]